MRKERRKRDSGFGASGKLLSLDWEKLKLPSRYGLIDLGIDVGLNIDLATGEKAEARGEGKGEIRYRKREKGPFISVDVGFGIKWGEHFEGYGGVGVTTGVLF